VGSTVSHGRIDAVLGGALINVAAGMEVRARKCGGLSALRERRDLEPETVRALDAIFPALAEKDRKCAIPGWPGVGNVDVIVRQSPGPFALGLSGELKWCGGDQLCEAMWDLFKMALISTRRDVDAAYLITGAPLATWDADQCSDLFESKTHTTRELCARRYPGEKHRPIWDWMLEGGYDRFPAEVPESITTSLVASLPMRAGDETWDLRAVRVSAAGLATVRFQDGWPDGNRPLDAAHPLRS
jgi:hypothetical protein